MSASRAKEILTKGRGKGVDFGQSAISLVYELIAERMTGELTYIENDATRWGNLYEVMNLI
ncbi:hypothetical protein KY334_01510 [Candidatus Woesearchaeota archaeon]|nr:hypothetical protein [Candidatus Woesearchaeota archaeon]